MPFVLYSFSTMPYVFEEITLVTEPSLVNTRVFYFENVMQCSKQMRNNIWQHALSDYILRFVRQKKPEKVQHFSNSFFLLVT